MSNRRRPKNARRNGHSSHLRIVPPAPERKEDQPPFEPKYNAYQCQTCDKIFGSVDLDPGVTPMFSPCLRTEGCMGVAVSAGYPEGPIPDSIPILIEWYTPATLNGLRPEVAEHVRKGGLVRRAAKDAPEWIKAIV